MNYGFYSLHVLARNSLQDKLDKLFNQLIITIIIIIMAIIISLDNKTGLTERNMIFFRFVLSNFF